MNLQTVKQRLLNGDYSDCLKTLYGEAQASAKRYAEACDAYAALFSTVDDISLFSAPGRTEVGGNHTDHQHGRVLAGSVNLDVIAVVGRNDDGIVRIQSKGYDMDVIDLRELDAKEAEIGRAASLIRGMCGLFAERGYKIGGFDAYTTSNVLKGSGLSSSAAFEVLVGFILNGLFNGGAISPVEIAKIAQQAERNYFGKPCGLMDQMASAVGGFTGIDFKDPADPIIEKVEFDLNAYGHHLCVVNTGGNHADLTGDYADITAECREISHAMGKDFLRDVDVDLFYERLPELRKTCSDRAILRAIHFFADNQKALDEKEALKAGDFEGFLKLINASGDSSFKYLQNVYSNSCVSEQGLSIALALTERFLKGRGACRVHGGGFAGTIQCFIPDDLLDDYKKAIELVFGSGSCYVLSIRPVGGCTITLNEK